VVTLYPGAVDNATTLPPVAPGETITSAESNNQSDAIKATQTLLGIPNSAVNVNAVWYMLKNTSGGHAHSGTDSRAIPYSSLTGTHGSAAHAGNILPANSAQVLGAGSISITQQPASGVGTPASGTRVLFVDAADGKAKVKDLNGTVVSLEEQGGTGTGGGAPTNAPYLIATSTNDTTLTNEVLVGTTPGGELGGTWPLPTVDDLHAGVAHSAMARLAVANTHTLGPNTFQTGGISIRAIIARGAAGQSVPLQEWQDSSAAVLASVSQTGVFTFPSAQFAAPVATSTANNAGTAATLARSDHVHATTGGTGTVTFGANPADVSATVEAGGTSTAAAREDHVHFHGLLTALPDAHHPTDHSDTRHTGPSRIEARNQGVIPTNRWAILNFPRGGRFTDVSASTRYDITVPGFVVPFVTGPTVADVTPTVADRIFAGGGQRFLYKVDLDDVQEVRLTGSITTASTSANNPRVLVRYSATGGTTLSAYSAMGASSTEVSVPVNATGGVDSGWIPLVAGAKNPNRWLLFITAGGDGATTGNFTLGNAMVHFR
jgi:hypothetical protein